MCLLHPALGLLQLIGLGIVGERNYNLSDISVYMQTHGYVKDSQDWVQSVVMWRVIGKYYI